MIQPLNNNLIIEVQKQEKTAGGILLVKDDLIIEEAKVIATPKGSEIKKGDYIYFKAYAMETIEMNSKIYNFLKEDQVLGVKK